MCDDPFPDFDAEGNLPCAADSTTNESGISGDDGYFKMSQWFVDPPLLGNGDLAFNAGFAGRVPYYPNGQGAYRPAYNEGCGYFRGPFTRTDGSYLSYEPSAQATCPLVAEIKSGVVGSACTAVLPPPSKLKEATRPDYAASQSSGGVVPSVRSYCKVCGDTASGNHFGVLSCEACKSFFRRSIRANARYACRWTRNCVVDRYTRNRCKYCRLEKCVLVGMKKDAVQEDRLVLGYSLMPKVVTIPTQTPVEVHLLPKFHTSAHRTLYQTAQEFQEKTSLAKRTDRVSENLADSTSGLSMNAVQDPAMLCNRFPITMPTLLNIVIEPKLKDLKPLASRVSARDVIDTLQHVCFTKVVRWAAQIPSFTQLELDDQVRLLKASWCEQCILLFAVDNIVVSKTAFVLDNYLCDRDKVEDPMVAEIVDRIIDDVTYWLNYLHVNDTELACLRALLLFNPGAKCLSPVSRQVVELYQEQILSGLGAYITQNYGISSPRLAKLVLQLGSIKAISQEMIQRMVMLQTQGTVTMENTFCELMQFD